MTLTAAQQKLVEDNLGLVGKVIAQKVMGFTISRTIPMMISSRLDV